MQEQIDTTFDSLADHDAERSVIGSILIDGDVIHSVADKLNAKHFDSQAHQYIYGACMELAAEGTRIDHQTLRSRLETNGHLDDIGGDSYLSMSVSHLPHALNIKNYAEVVINLYTLRRLADAGRRAVEIGTDITRAKDPERAIREVEELVFEIGASSTAQDFVKLSETAFMLALKRDDRDRDDVEADNAPISTGLSSIDDYLGGLHRSDLVVVAARPGVGKSTLALNCALNAADPVNPNSMKKVGIFSLEMSIDQIIDRMAASLSRVDISSIRKNEVTRAEQRKLDDAYNRLQNCEIFVDDSAIQTVAAMRTKAQRLKSMRGLDLLIVDYMQLISGSVSGRDRNRVQEVSEISRYLKAIARDLNVPVLACSQLNREIEHRKSHEPRLSDLRESGSIEQDADIVMFIHRDDKNINEEEWYRRNPTQDYPRGQAKIVIAKHRHGPTGDLTLTVRDEWGLFSSVEYVGNVQN